MKRWTIGWVLSGLLSLPSLAQSPNQYGWTYDAFPTGYGWVVPRASPTTTLIQQLGVTEIHLRYSRPAVRGREVWGGLVPWGRVWRAGANEATLLSFSTPVQIEGHDLPAGTYALFAIPTPDDWTLIFSSRPHQWGHFTYQESEDVLRVTVPSQTTDEHREFLEYSIPHLTDRTAQVVLHWEKRRIAFTVAADAATQAAALANRTFDWQAGWFAADYFFKAGAHAEALRWVNASLAMQEQATTQWLKARILAGLERYEEAIAIAEGLMETGPSRLQMSIEPALAAWRTRVP